MTETYPNAPLVELIAEVQWFVQEPPGAPMQLNLEAAAYDAFANKMDELGFTHSERLIPEGFPTLAGQIVARFRSRRDQPPLYQIGPGIFSANGLPPTYSNWEGFAPFLFRGLDAVAGARSRPEEPFASIKLRYIDAFGPGFLRGKSAQDFITEDLGFTVNLPNVVSQAALTGTTPLVTLQTNSPIDRSGELQVSVGHGNVDGIPRVLLDVTVAYSGVGVDQTADRFNDAHEIAHAVFEGSTATLRDIMRAERSQ